MASHLSISIILAAVALVALVTVEARCVHLTDERSPSAEDAAVRARRWVPQQPSCRRRRSASEDAEPEAPRRVHREPSEEEQRAAAAAHKNPITQGIKNSYEKSAAAVIESPIAQAVKKIVHKHPTEDVRAEIPEKHAAKDDTKPIPLIVVPASIEGAVMPEKEEPKVDDPDLMPTIETGAPEISQGMESIPLVPADMFDQYKDTVNKWMPKNIKAIEKFHKSLDIDPLSDEILDGDQMASMTSAEEGKLESEVSLPAAETKDKVVSEEKKVHPEVPEVTEVAEDEEKNAPAAKLTKEEQKN